MVTSLLGIGEFIWDVFESGQEGKADVVAGRGGRAGHSLAQDGDVAIGLRPGKRWLSAGQAPSGTVSA